MKIRGDFVTNSSSVSYILTMKEDVFDTLIDSCGEKSGTGQFLRFIKEKIKKEGNKTILDGEEIYYLKLKFATDEAQPLDGIDYDITNQQFYHEMYDQDISSYSNEELNSFLYWAILYPTFLPQIGATRVETI